MATRFRDPNKSPDRQAKDRKARNMLLDTIHARQTQAKQPPTTLDKMKAGFKTVRKLGRQR